jgi:hypothetical protein
MRKTSGQGVPMHYKSSDSNWQEFYLSEIVVPIRMELKYKNPKKEGYEYKGFLCADAKSANAFREDEIEDYERLLKAVADYLYIYFDRIQALQSMHVVAE